MSIQAIAWALQQDIRPCAAKLCLIVIANYADSHNRAWPSKARIARDASTDKSWVCKQVALLKAAGLIEVEERVQDGVSLTSIITLNISSERRSIDSGGVVVPAPLPVVKNGGGSGAEATGGSGAGSTRVVEPRRHYPLREPLVEPEEESPSVEGEFEFAVANVDPPHDEVSKADSDFAEEPIPRDDPRPRSEAMPVQQAWEAFQRMALPAGLPIPRMLTPALRSSIGARLRESGKTTDERLAVWDEMLAKVAASSFLRGRNDRSFRADLHWLVKPANYAKALAGNYDDRPAAPEKPGGLIPQNQDWSSVHAQAGRFGSARPQRNSTDEIVAAAMRGLEQYNAGRAFR